MIDELFIEERTKARIREVITKQWEKGRISDPGLDALAVVVRPSAWYETTDPCPLDFLPSCHYSPEKSKFNIALDKAINLVREELLRAITIHGSMKSHHDAQSVIAEENDELRRSEERRVGKECRSRWSPYH